MHNAVLRYLYDNDTGKYHDLYLKFAGRKVTVKRLNEIIKDIREYVDQESVYEYRGLLTLDVEPISDGKEFAELNVKINQKGREKYESTWNEKKTRNINKRIAAFTLIAAFMGALPFLIPIVIDAVKSQMDIIPIIKLHVDNRSGGDMTLFNLQDFFLWRQNHCTIGRYEIINKNDTIILHKGITILSAKIINSKTYFPYLNSKECDISLSIRNLDGLYISDDFLPFNVENIKKYYTEIVIEKK